MTAKRMRAEDLRDGLKYATERLKTLRQRSTDSRDQFKKYSESWTEHNAAVGAYDLSLDVLFCATHGEFGEEYNADGAQ